MLACVVGFGSIGKRHAEILSELVDEVCVVSSYEVEGYQSYKSIPDVLASKKVDYFVIAKPTADHSSCLRSLESGTYNGKVLVEKPLYDKPEAKSKNTDNIFVAYNFRFHWLVEEIKKTLVGENVLSVHAYVGQYLPTWRPGTDYRESYSASKSKGGGVLRDLSHELDYLSYLFGSWKSVCAVQSKSSSLEIETDDCLSALIEFETLKNCSLELNYLDRIGSRNLIINTDSKTIKADFVEQKLQINDDVQTQTSHRNDSYRKQHEAVLNGYKDQICSYEDGSELVDLIEAIEESSKKREWVRR